MTETGEGIRALRAESGIMPRRGAKSVRRGPSFSLLNIYHFLCRF
jgi:hypothetical protein